MGANAQLHWECQNFLRKLRETKEVIATWQAILNIDDVKYRQRYNHRF